jgi:4-amino-4-deoxy-L-arabinose transferase-like glycosyltransferase
MDGTMSIPPSTLRHLAAFYAPFMGYLMVTGGLEAPSRIFPFGFIDPLSALSHVILISRLVSVFMAVAIVLLVYLVVRQLFDRDSALFAALIVTLSYPFVGAIGLVFAYAALFPIQLNVLHLTESRSVSISQVR